MLRQLLTVAILASKNFYGFCLQGLFCSAVVLGEQHVLTELATQIFSLSLYWVDCMGTAMLSSIEKVRRK